MSARKSEMILGPTLRDIVALDLTGENVDIATAFYTGGALDRLRITAKNVRILCRLDLQSVDEWGRGVVAPDALLSLMDRLTLAGSKVSLFVDSQAHIKAYIGKRGALVGSANLTMRGFGGGLELVASLSEDKEIEAVRESLDLYQQRLTEISIEDLRQYVQTNIKDAKSLQQIAKQKKQDAKAENRFPNVARDKISSALGSYESFLRWLEKQAGDGARETLARARGKGHLQGHIHRNFYGLRQFLLAYPDFQLQFSKADASLYKLSKDSAMEKCIATFVRDHAADEVDFRLSVWKTYLPRECGGYAGKHGGTIGNLNRMLPLVAKYLEVSRKSKRARLSMA